MTLMFAYFPSENLNYHQKIYNFCVVLLSRNSNVDKSVMKTLKLCDYVAKVCLRMSNTMRQSRTI